ncbi:MAG: hypothetical protein GYA14_13885 [Ignavibacteria bacterium]|nr:hypothetical protein [Ignavibacteria bacterium]
MSKKIKKTVKATIVLCVTLGRKTFGFLGFSNFRMKDNTCLLVFDFVVLNYKKLSKLLIMLARSLEVKAFISEKLLTNLDTLLTAVFTDNPVSMKYRGEWELKERKSGKLIYKTGFYNTKDEEFKRWKEKYLK